MKQLDIIFNKLPEQLKSETVLKYLADQLKLAAWALGGANYLIAGDNNKLYSLLFIIPSWAICQYLAVYLLTKIDEDCKQ